MSARPQSSFASGFCVGAAAASTVGLLAHVVWRRRQAQRQRRPTWAEAFVARTLFSEEEIAAGVQELSKRLNAEYGPARAIEEKGDDTRGHDGPLLLGVLNGVFVFLADLTRQLDFEHDLDFIRASSYGTGGTEQGELLVDIKTKFDVRGREVILVDDLVDTGRTLKKLVSTIEAMGAKSVKTLCLVDKVACRKVDLEVDYVALRAPNEWVLGYGMDSKERFRSLPFIAVASQKAMDGDWDAAFRTEASE
jgi:hypoxanthine phosphoribosyltransferase